MPPGHVTQFSALFILHILIIDVLLPLLFDVESIGLDDRDVGRWADVVRTCVLLAVGAF